MWSSARKNVLLNVAVTATKIPDFNGDGEAARGGPYLLYNPTTLATAIWHMNGSQILSKVTGADFTSPQLGRWWRREISTATAGSTWRSFTGQSSRQIVVWYMNDATRIAVMAPVRCSRPDGHRRRSPTSTATASRICCSSTPAPGRLKIWHLNGVTFVSEGVGPTLPSGWTVAAANDFNADGSPDYVAFSILQIIRQRIWTMNNNTFCQCPDLKDRIAGLYIVEGLEDFNGDGHPDFLLYKAATLQTGELGTSTPTTTSMPAVRRACRRAGRLLRTDIVAGFSEPARPTGLSQPGYSPSSRFGGKPPPCPVWPQSDRVRRMITRPITPLARRTCSSSSSRRSESGRFHSESEVVAEALSVNLQFHEEIRRAKFAELKAKIQTGIDQLDRGETVEFSTWKSFRLTRMPNTPPADAAN